MMAKSLRIPLFLVPNIYICTWYAPAALHVGPVEVSGPRPPGPKKEIKEPLMLSYSAYEARVDGVLLMQLQVLVSSEGRKFQALGRLAPEGD